MAGFIAKWLFKETLENKFGKDDPYFESIPAKRLGGKPKKRRKANPPGLSSNDNKVLTKVKRRAYRLDMCLSNCCGIRFGWSSIIGFVPVIGDVLDLMFALMVLRTCMGVDNGLPPMVKMKMIFNVAIDFAVGLVPFLGDIADALFRANTRNLIILEDYLREVGKQNLRERGLPQPSHDPSDPNEYDNYDDDSSSSMPPSRDGVMPPPAARVKQSGGGGGRSGQSGRADRISGGKGSSSRRNDLRDQEEGLVGSSSRKDKSSRRAR